MHSITRPARHVRACRPALALLLLAAISAQAAPATPSPPAPQILAAGTAVTAAARADQAALCSGAASYPAQFTWQGPPVSLPPVAARRNTPRIEQFRAGKLIATYTSFANQPGCTYLGGGQDALTPMGFFLPRLLPGDPAWPAAMPLRVLKNAYVGFCGTPYLGGIALRAGFADLNGRFALAAGYVSDEAALATALPLYQGVIGTPSYLHRAAAGPLRQRATLGAMD